MEDYEKTKLTCSKCKGNASMNTPAVNEEGTEIFCHNCLDNARDNVYRYGIKQRSDLSGGLDADDNMHMFWNGFTLAFYPATYGKRVKYDNGTKERRVGFHKPMYRISARTNDGAAFPLSQTEQLEAIQNPKSVFYLMSRMKDKGLFRCTTCGSDTPESEIGGRPLFAGKVCKKCWGEHLKHLDEQRKNGHVCTMCGHPYDNCCC